MKTAQYEIESVTILGIKGKIQIWVDIFLLPKFIGAVVKSVLPKSALDDRTTETIELTDNLDQAAHFLEKGDFLQVTHKGRSPAWGIHEIRLTTLNGLLVYKKPD